MDREPPLGIVDEAEILACLLDRYNVHEAGRISSIGADLPIYLDEALHDDRLGLAGIKSVLQSKKSQ